MALPLTILHGPLPQNGVAVDPSTFLEAWISSSALFNLGAGAFKGGTLNFIVSSTDPPALQDRQRGTLWFQRGTGLLYIWDQNDLPSGASNAAADVTNWIAIAGRRDIWLRCIERVEPGVPLILSESGASNTEHQLTIESATGLLGDPNLYRVKWAGTQFVGPHAQVNPLSVDNHLNEVVFVALDSAASGGMLRAVEVGFCTGYMASGQTGIAGELAIDETSSQTQWFKREPYTILTGMTAGRLFMAHATDSSATNPGTPWRRPIFKRSLPPFGTARV